MAKRIYIVRHAKSSWDDYRIEDHDRPLNDRGIKDGKMMAQWLKSQEVSIDKIITSSADRAKMTASFFESEFQIKAEPSRNLYLADPLIYLDLINEQSEDIHSIMMFGHNPGITYLANLVESGCTDNVPTTGIVIIEVADDKPWNDVYWNDMELVKIKIPKSLTWG